MFNKIAGLLTLLCFILGLVSCYSQYLLNKDEWSGGGTVMKVLTNDGKLVELKTIPKIKNKLQRQKIKGSEWDPVLKTWSDREVSLSEVRYLWVEQIDDVKTTLFIIMISVPVIFAMTFSMDFGCLLCGVTFP